jgi:hypothetical protein
MFTFSSDPHKEEVELWKGNTVIHGHELCTVWVVKSHTIGPYCQVLQCSSISDLSYPYLFDRRLGMKMPAYTPGRDIAL